jgi:glycosyltransferase involved in cell wall biosynthesis
MSANLGMSLIIPTAGRPQLVLEAIKSALPINQNLSSISGLSSFEIIIVDNNFTESSSIELRYALEPFREVIKYIRQPLPGLTAARHLGASVARGEILSFIDDDAQISLDWARAVVESFKNDGVVLVGGPSIPIFDREIPNWFWQFIVNSKYGGWHCQWLSLSDFGRDVSGVDPKYIWGLNFSISKSTLYEVGGFNPDIMPAPYMDLRGDGETGLSIKLSNAGKVAFYSRNASVKHYCGSDRLNKEYFLKRAFESGQEESFTEFRSSGGLKKNGKIIFRFVLWGFTILNLTVQSFLPKGISQTDFSSVRFRIETYRQFLKGFKDHRIKLKENSQMRNWVLRDSFLDNETWIFET